MSESRQINKKQNNHSARYPPQSTEFTTHVPNRLDRLPWCRWHWLVVIGLGVTWILDGLEVTLAGAVGGVLKQSLHMSDAQVGASATFYLLGAVIGAIGFGYATDRLGRKKLFTVTLLVYLIATACSALAWNFWSFAFFRFVTGSGIGGEYAAINSAIDELIPARIRGHVDLIINATYWIGAAVGALATILLLNTHAISPSLGWRFTFLLGAMLGIVIIFIRHFIPESPRWLMTHGREEEAERIVTQVESEVGKRCKLPEPEGEPLTITARHGVSWKEIWQAMVHTHGTRSLLGLGLMISQAFFYNAIFFTYALLLIEFYSVKAEHVGFYLLPFSLSNALGPFIAGKLFDTVGRKPMITATYALSGILLAITGWLFQRNALTSLTQTICWTVIFFIASCAASSAYLTVSEIFPLEIRAMAIAIFYALGTLAGGVGAPALFGALIGSGSRTHLFYGYLFGALLMLIAAGMEWKLGVKAERQSLESISAPLAKAS
ncbi:MAG TPA: MFS transporter [Candidatus Angelobacter sp.]|nr:MFS transporter [Candidatus Angelobacter sp.]